MPVTAEQAKTELRRRRATEELARRRQPEPMRMGFPRQKLPGVWDYDRQLDKLFGGRSEDALPFDVKYDFGKVVGIAKPDEDKIANSLVYSILMDKPLPLTYSIVDQLNELTFGKPIDVKKALSEYRDYYTGAKSYVGAIKHGFRRAGVMMTKQVAGVTKMVGEFVTPSEKAIERAIFPALNEFEKTQGDKLKEWSDMMLAAVDEYYTANKHEAIQIAPGIGYWETLEQYITKPTNLVQGLVESSPLILEGILGGVFGGTAGAITTMSVPISGEVYADARAKDTEPLPAMAQAILTGTGEATIEVWTLSRKLGLVRNFRKMVAGGLPKVMWEGIKAFFRGTAEEGSQEFNRNFWRWLFTDRSQQWTENVAESMAAGGPMEMVMAGTFSAAGAIGPTISKEEQIQRLDKIQEAVEIEPTLDNEAKIEIIQEIATARQDVLDDVYPETVEKPPEIAPEAPRIAPETKKVAEVAEIPAIAEIEALGDKELKEKFLSAKPTSPEWVATIKEMKRRKIELEVVQAAETLIPSEIAEKPTVAPPVEEVVAEPTEVAKPPATAEGKEAWEMTLQEFAEAELDKGTIIAEGLHFKKKGQPVIAAFKDTKTGKVVETGAVHDLNKIPKGGFESGRWDIGFVEEGQFYDREAYRFRQAKNVHRQILRKALSENKQVPKNILLQYKSEKWAQEALKEKPKAEVKPELEPAKLRQRIHAIAAIKGLTKKALSDLKKKHVGFRRLTGKVASKKITTEQLQNLLKAVEKARPKQVGYKRVITRKTEKKIQSLKENLIKKIQMTEKHFDEILEIEVHGKEPKYIDAKHFITETEGKDIIKRMLDVAEIVRLTESFEQAITKNPEIAEQVKSLDNRIEKSPKRDPYSLESMRYYNQQAQVKTGAPIFTSYMDLMDTHLDIIKTRTATWKRFGNEISNFKDIAKDNEALRRVSDYIASQSTLKEKPAMPKDITANETKLAKEIQKILEDYRLKVRVTKFYNWYYYNQPIPDHDRYRTEITKATDIYESKGREELIDYLKTQEWGVIHSGYEPLDILFHKVRPYTTGAATIGKGHIKIRTDIEYHKQERNILQRLSAYMRQIDMLYNLSPKINAYVRLWDDNANKFSEWGKVKNDVEIFLRNLKRYNIEGGFFERNIARAYSQAMRVIIMPSPVLSFRNLFQNFAFEHDKTILIDPRNENLSDERIEYLETYVLQTRAMVEEYFMVGEKPLPLLKTLTKLIDKVKLYPYSDIANRHWSFWAKTNQVDRALTAETIKQMMTEAKFEDMKELEQRRALGILARDGKEAMTQYIGRVHVDDVHFLYERSQRSPAEMTSLGKVVGNLMLFPRAYGEKLAHATNKMLKGKTYKEQWRGLKTIFAVVGGGMIVGSIYTMVTGRKRNPYDPLEILTFRPGGLAWGSIEAAADVYANILSAAKGDSRALAALTTAIPRAADMFIPFYDYSLRAIEAATDQKNIDRRALRKMRMIVDKEYKIRGGAYKVKRTALEKWQYFISGPSADVEEKKTIRAKVQRKSK